MFEHAHHVETPYRKLPGNFVTTTNVNGRTVLNVIYQQPIE